MNDKNRRRVLMIGLDAAEPSLIETWMAEGSLPNLQRLREQGLYGRLSSSAKWMAGSPWPTFYTGTTPAEHGLYHYLQWRTDQMTIARPNPDWLPLQPFWESFGPGDPRVVAVDVPTTYAPKPFNGSAISGWATHDRPGSPASYPADLIERIQHEFGSSPVKPEVYGRQSISSLLNLRDRLNQATNSVAGLAETLMAGEDWDLFIVTFGATHTGGHKLWDRTGTADENGHVQPEFDQALKSIYMNCDKAVARLTAGADENTTTLVFSVHGMGPNHSRVEILSEMLNRILSNGNNEKAASRRPGLLSRLRMAVPLEWRSNVKSRLPTFIQDKLTAFWLLRSVDWSKIRAFAMAGADLQGYIRFNVTGREAEGIVKPQEVEKLAYEITSGLLTFVDSDTGEPVIDEIKRPEEIYPPGERLAELPDLIVRWHDSPLAKQRAIVSPLHGEILLPTPGFNSNGRSGNHRSQGFLIATGQGIDAGGQFRGADIIDLAPTVLALFGLPVPAKMRGRMLFDQPSSDAD